MKILNKIFVLCLGLAVLLCGCAGNTNGNYYDKLSVEDKTIIYQSYLEGIVDKIKENSYYMYDMHFDDNDLCYQLYNKLNYKQYAFMQDGTKEGFILDVDDQYAYIYLDAFKDEKGKTIRTTVDESVLELLKGYEKDINSVLKNLEFVSLEKTDTIFEDKYYVDKIQIKTMIDDQEYIGSTQYYITEDRNVKVNENMDILLIATLDCGANHFGITQYENEDKSNEREETEFTDVQVSDFTSILNNEISKL